MQSRGGGSVSAGAACCALEASPAVHMHVHARTWCPRVGCGCSYLVVAFCMHQAVEYVSMGCGMCEYVRGVGGRRSSLPLPTHCNDNCTSLYFPACPYLLCCTSRPVLYFPACPCLLHCTVLYHTPILYHTLPHSATYHMVLCSTTARHPHLLSTIPPLHCTASVPPPHSTVSVPPPHCTASAPPPHCTASVPPHHCTSPVVYCTCTALQGHLLGFRRLGCSTGLICERPPAASAGPPAGFGAGSRAGIGGVTPLARSGSNGGRRGISGGGGSSGGGRAAVRAGPDLVVSWQQLITGKYDLRHGQATMVGERGMLQQKLT